MIRSLFSGVSGMKTHQIRMDVIGNNIANVNQTGFKGSRANFQDILYQNVRFPSSANSTTLGGTNPGQVGLGQTISSITNNTGQGALQSTGRTLDLAVQGNGWFVVTDGTNKYYTREGVFYIDNDGNMVNSNGFKLCDTTGANIQIDVSSNGVGTINIAKDGSITGKYLDGTTGLSFSSGTGAIGLATFPNQDGLERVGQSLFKESIASGPPIGSGTFGTPGSGGYGTVNSGYLEMSNVDLTDEFAAMITTQRGYQANARTITTSDQMLQELLEIKR